MDARSLRRMILAPALAGAALLAAAWPLASAAQDQAPAEPAAPAAADSPTKTAIEPTFAIFDVKLGAPVSSLPDRDVNDISCGTNGGPPSLLINHFADFAKCTPEKSGLREVYFTYDDELAYIALATQSEYRAYAAKTAVYAHPAVVSVLISEDGIVRGLRVATDDKASIPDRRLAVWLGRNFEGQYKSYNLTCKDIPPTNGEEPVGGIFVHKVCDGHNDALNQNVEFESQLLRKKGETTFDPVTRKPMPNMFDSRTWLEVVQAPYVPNNPSAR